MNRKDTNPKDAVAIRKPPMSTIPAYVMAEVGVGMLEGALKYGRHNYRVSGVRASVYYDAAMRHLELSSQLGAVVLDLFGGSGSTLMAAETCDRSARIMEIDPVYADVIIKRWQEYTGEKAINIDTGELFDGEND